MAVAVEVDHQLPLAKGRTGDPANLRPQARSHPVCVQASRGGQSCHHGEENTSFPPPLPSVLERPVWTILPRRIAPAQPVAVHESDAGQRQPIINPWLAVAVGDVRLKPRHLLVRQSKKPFIRSSLASPEHDRDAQINGF